MGLDDEFSELVQLIYATPTEGYDWRAVSRGLMHITGSCSSCISVIDHHRARYCTSALYGSEDSKFADGSRDYEEVLWNEDPTFQYAATNPDATLIDSEAVIGTQDYVQHPFVKWTRSAFRTSHWRIRSTKIREGLALGITLHTPQEEGRMRSADAAMFDRIFPHVRRAVLFHARPPELASKSAALLSIDLAGRVLQVSDKAAGLIAAMDGLTLQQSFLKTTNAAAQERLDKAIAMAIRPRLEEAETGTATVPRPSGKEDYLLLVEPLPRKDHFSDWMGAAAIVRVVDPTEQLGISDVHARLFGLTPREWEVADMLLRGFGPEAAAANLGISYETARVHLRALFRKTGTSRQAQLIERLLRVS